MADRVMKRGKVRGGLGALIGGMLVGSMLVTVPTSAHAAPAPAAAFPGPVLMGTPNVPAPHPSNGTVISGTSDPGDTVLLWRDDPTDFIGQVTSDGAGNWSFTPGIPLPHGTVVRIISYDADSHPSAPAFVTVDAVAPAEPTIEPSNGVVVTGTAEPNSTVRVWQVLLGGAPELGVTTANAEGRWSLSPTSSLFHGAGLYATARDAAGNTSGSGYGAVITASEWVASSLPELEFALADCGSAPLTIRLGADISATGDQLTIGCDTTLDLGVFDLSVHNIVIDAGVEFEVTGPTDGSEGMLTVDASAQAFRAGIRTTDAALRVSGGQLRALAGVNASAIGGALGESAGTLRVSAGTVRAVGAGGGYGTAIGGGYLAGGGGVVEITGGAVYAETSARYAAAVGGGGAGASGDGGAGADVTVTGGSLTATAVSIAIGGGGSGLDAEDRPGSGGTLTIGPSGVVTASANRSALGADRGFGSNRADDPFGQVQVDGTLHLPSGALRVSDDPSVSTEFTVGATGRVLGDPDHPATGATITGTGRIDNGGVIALAPPAGIVTGNNRLVTFETEAPDVRVFAPSFGSGYRALPAPPAGAASNLAIAWNTASDGTGAWFTPNTSTAGAGTTALYPVVRATLQVSTAPDLLVATAGAPFDFPVIVNGPDGAPLDPQPAIAYSAPGCGFDGTSVFTAAGTCTVTASATVHGVPISEAFEIEVQAGAAVSLTLTPSATTALQGGSIAFTMTGEDQYGNAVDTSAAVVNSSDPGDIVGDGRIEFALDLAQPGSATRTLTAWLGMATSEPVAVTVDSAVRGLALEPSASAVAVGGTLGFSVTALDAGGDPLGDVTAHSIVVSDGLGDGRVVTGVRFGSSGERRIEASYGALTVAITVAVDRAPVSLVMTPRSSTIEAGESITPVITVGGMTDGPVPTGTIDVLLDGEIVCDEVWLMAGSTLIQPGATSSCAVLGTTAGTKQFSLAYSGDANYLPSMPDPVAPATLTVVAGAAAELVLTPSATTVEQGGVLSFKVRAEDSQGNRVDASGAVLTSSVASDVIDGLTVRFPHASPHVITATLGSATTSVTIEVRPAASPTPDTPATKRALEATGSSGAAAAGALALAAGLGVLGAVLILVRRRSAS